jgi:hypothetical protein
MFKRLALALILIAGAASAEPRLTFAGKATFTDPVGGLSGIEVLAGGVSGLMISDRGEILKLFMKRENNTLKFVKAWHSVPTPQLNGDVEGLATLDGETFAFSLEGPARVIVLESDDNITTLRSPSEFWALEANKSLEALAIRADGALITIPEKPEEGADAFPVFSYENGSWSIIAELPKRGSYQVVGADFGPDGLLYVLERALTAFGFRSRVRRFDLTAQNLSEQTLLTSRPSKYDNLEGISVWTDTAGQTRVTMVSDNNNMWVLRNEIVEYILQE